MWVALGLLALTVVLIFAAVRWGKKIERADTQKEILDAVDKTKRAVDNARHDPAHADRVRKKYERVLPDR